MPSKNNRSPKEEFEGTIFDFLDVTQKVTELGKPSSGQTHPWIIILKDSHKATHKLAAGPIVLTPEHKHLKHRFRFVAADTVQVVECNHPKSASS
jgi:hypothetical protein